MIYLTGYRLKACPSGIGIRTYPVFGIILMILSERVNREKLNYLQMIIKLVTLLLMNK